MATPRKAKPEKVGRKLFDGKNIDIVLKKLEEAFSIGCSDVEACAYADISTTALYNYQKANPSFRERKEQLKEKPVLLARKVVVDAIQKGDQDLAFKYLERKRRDEFAVRVENENRAVEKWEEVSDDVLADMVKSASSGVEEDTDDGKDIPN